MSLRVEAAISIETNLQNKLLEKSNNIRQLDQ